MLLFKLWSHLTFFLYVYVHHNLALPQAYQKARSINEIPTNGICPGQRAPTNLCERCIHRGLNDKKTCIVIELTQKTADRVKLMYPTERTSDFIIDGKPQNLPANKAVSELFAGIVFTWRGIRVSLNVNIDSCSRVDWLSPTGPFETANGEVSNASIGTVVEELFRLSPKKAIELVRDNAQRGKQEAENFLNEASLDQSISLTISQEVEGKMLNASVKAIQTILYKGVGGAATMLGVQALSHELLSVHPAVDMTLEVGAVAVLALEIQHAIVDWLEEVLERDPTFAAYEWFLWIVQSTINRVRELVRRLPPLPRLDREAIDRAIPVWARSVWGFRLPQLGMTGVSEEDVPTGPDIC